MWYIVHYVACVLVLQYIDLVTCAPADVRNVTEADFYRLYPVVPGLGRFRRAATAPYSDRPGQASRANTCQYVRAVPEYLRSGANIKPHGLDNFYQKYTEAYGIPVLSSNKVPDDALKRACYTLRFLLASHSKIRESFYLRSGRVAVISEHEGTVDIPEHSDMSEWWNERARGLGATPYNPISSGGEENLLCYPYPRDRYYNQDIFLHETAHAVHLIGAAFAIDGWDARLRTLYQESKNSGLWANTYSMSTAEEYFAEGTMSYFNVNAHYDQPNGIKGPISTRDKLYNYDLKLYSLINEVYPCENTYLKRCESDRAKEDAQDLIMDCDIAGSGNTEGSCVDDNQYCSAWADRGECEKSADYMKDHCKMSCNLCTVSTPCDDDNDNCQYWFETGECTKNSPYMSKHCKKSCGICGKQAPCEDENLNCDWWAKTGECSKNAAYMNLYCKKSCNAC